ncbi:thioredoxin [Cupriavidus pampae]|uniref:Thioredoxin n=1 Tax=Cupriavidus pampae TaxID=659251 RepID=A0ABM8WPS1_9BURK|nr:thioredoxin [Cupriavidus pampae]CAG9169421.1 Chaperedoxin [Cupriavidus pampae]
MSDVTLQNFEAEVIELSRQVPVLVDFWAPWCGPCRTLGPMLEKLEAEAAGTWRLAKVNVDENQQLAAHFGIRSIPHVVAFVDGEAVDQFTGVLPESGLREFLERLSPNPADLALVEARHLLEAGDRDGAQDAFQAALAYDPGADDVRLAYISFLLDGNAIADAETEFTRLSPQAAQLDAFAALRTRIDAMQNVSDLPDASTLIARVEAQPTDLAARLDLAQVLIARREYESALAQLLEVVKRDRAFGDDAGRKTMLSVFEMLTDQPDIVSRWRRQLSTALN